MIFINNRAFLKVYRPCFYFYCWLYFYLYLFFSCNWGNLRNACRWFLVHKQNVRLLHSPSHAAKQVQIAECTTGTLRLHFSIKRCSTHSIRNYVVMEVYTYQNMKFSSSSQNFLPASRGTVDLCTRIYC